MEKIVIALSFLMISIGAVSAQEGEYKKLEGHYTISGESLTDPPPDEKKDRVVMSIEGESAKDIYNTMLTPARRTTCDGVPTFNLPRLMKTAGDLECFFDETNKIYQCLIGIKLDTGATVFGYVCDGD